MSDFIKSDYDTYDKVGKSAARWLYEVLGFNVEEDPYKDRYKIDLGVSCECVVTDDGIHWVCFMEAGVVAWWQDEDYPADRLVTVENRKFKNKNPKEIIKFVYCNYPHDNKKVLTMRPNRFIIIDQSSVIEGRYVWHKTQRWHRNQIPDKDGRGERFYSVPQNEVTFIRIG